MTTRNRLQRGEEPKAAAPTAFEGRVRRWRKQPVMGNELTFEGKKLLFTIWRRTEQRGEPHVPRPNMAVVENPNSRPAQLPRFARAGEEARGAKRGRASLSGLGTEDRSATPAFSEGISGGVTQRTETTSAPKKIRLKLKSSAALAGLASGGAAGGSGAGAAAAATSPGDGAPGAAPALQAGAVRVGGANGGPLSPPISRIRLKIEPRPGSASAAAGPAAPPQQPAREPGPRQLQQQTAQQAQQQQPSSNGGEEDDLLAVLEPREPCSPRNLDELIPDVAAAARHDATAVLLARERGGNAGGGGGAPFGAGGSMQQGPLSGSQHHPPQQAPGAW